MRIDLHTHSTFSDGTDSPTRLVLNAASIGLDIISLTDHDTFEGIPEAIEAASRAGIQILSGVEISCQGEHGSDIHLLGYGCRIKDRAINDELKKLREARVQRVPNTLAKLSELGIDLSEEDVAKFSANKGSVGRPHIADAMVEKGYVNSRTEAFDKYIGNRKPAFVSRYTVPVGEAIGLIHQAGGAAVLAHPLIEGRGPQSDAQQIELLHSKYGLDGIEVDHPSHDQYSKDLLHILGARLGLVRTGSSDYHGTGKQNHDLGSEHTRPTALRELLRIISARGGIGLVPYSGKAINREI